jgi:hypothetical protein
MAAGPDRDAIRNGLRPARGAGGKRRRQSRGGAARIREGRSRPRASLDITIEGMRALEEARTAHAGTKKTPRYSHEGDRPSTRHTAVMRLRLFGEWLGVDPLVLAALRQHENALRRGLNSVNKLKDGRLERLPSLSDTWRLAEDLLTRGRTARRRQTGQRLINEAAAIAIWTFLPLRLKDGQLVWGRDIYMLGDRYAIDIDTHKEGEPLRGRLHPQPDAFPGRPRSPGRGPRPSGDHEGPRLRGAASSVPNHQRSDPLGGLSLERLAPALRHRRPHRADAGTLGICAPRSGGRRGGR